MIFNIQNLTFVIGMLMLEGWPAFCARCACALVLAGAGWLVRSFLRTVLFPKLAAHSWRAAAAPILVRSFAVPAQRVAWYTGLYLALSSLPWAIAAVPGLLLTLYQMLVTLCVCQGLYSASGLAELLLAASAEEIRSNKTLVNLLNKAYKVLVVVLGAATIAQESGLPVGSVLAGAGLVGLTVSLAAQDTASNLFSGIVILLDRPFSLGDWVKIGDVEGEVVDINFRSTKIRTLDNSVCILTNSTVSSSTINNAAKRTKRRYSLTLGVAYKTTRAQLEALTADLAAMLRASEYTYEDSVIVRLTSFGPSSINISISAYLRTTDNQRFLEMQDRLNLDLLDVMKRNNVEFGIPSTNVYLAGSRS